MVFGSSANIDHKKAIAIVIAYVKICKKKNILSDTTKYFSISMATNKQRNPFWES
jgi:hypothetical protein